MITWILERLAAWVARLAQQLLANDDNPRMIALRRRGVAIIRQNAHLYHDMSRRLFVADDVDGVPSCLIDVSDRQTISWLHRAYLRRLPPSPGRTPLVIDLGANDGLIGSMSLNLVQLGWNAVLVEPLPDMLALARGNLEFYRRPTQTLVFIEAAIGPADGESQFETHNPNDLSQMEGRMVEAATATTRVVPVISADTFLARADVAGLVAAAGPVVLSVDIEGQDIAVTARLLELGLRPDVILFEVLRASEDELALFAKHGYEKLAHIGWNDVYVRGGSASVSGESAQPQRPMEPHR